MRQIKLRPEMAEHFKRYGLTKKDLKMRSAILWAGSKFLQKTRSYMLGTADWRVSYLDSVDLSLEIANEFEKYGVPHKLMSFEGGDHRLSTHREERNRATREWFDRYVRDNAPLPDLNLHGE